MQKRPPDVRLAIPILILLILACGPCNMLTGEPAAPPEPISVSTEAAGQLESRIRQNLDGEAGQQFILHTTDSEVTSLLATKLEQYEELPVADPQVWFTNGKIHGTGRLVNVVPFSAEFQVVASAEVHDGKVQVSIDEVSAGALPIPERLVDAISQSINETIDELQLDMHVTAIEILEGEAIIHGTRD